MTPRREWLGLAAALGLLVAGFSAATTHFFSWTTAVALANQAPEALLLTTGMTLVVLTGGIDLSVGSVLALSAAVFGTLLAGGHAGIGGSACAAVLVGGACGAANGWLSTRWRIPSFIVTLAMLEMARGATYLVTASQTQYLGTRVDAIAAEVGAGLRAPILVAVGVVVAGQWALSNTVAGRHVMAVGANDEAARLAGIDPRRVRLGAFAASGLLAGVAAIVQTGRLAAADPNAGIGLELEAIAAVVIGGASLSGGRGSVGLSALGAMVMAVLGAGLAQMGVQEPTRRLTTGAVIVCAAAADVWRRRASGVERPNA
jgi:ribose transport system permease protein